MASSLDGFSSGASLGGSVSHYRGKQNIYTQGAQANTLFYIQEGGVRLTARTKHQSSAVTAILGVGDLFGELCLAGYPLRVSTAVALTASSIRTIKKGKMLEMLRKKNKASNSLVAYLLSSVKNYQDHIAHLLTSSAEQRLARVLLRLAHLNKKGPAVVEIPILSHRLLAEMVGTHSPASQSVHESIQEAGLHQLRWGTGSASVVAESPPEPPETLVISRILGTS
ncbi:MAG: Crp/Fnr family transcriptional regulator, partial [Candidatus Acidiferrales bacterium]